MGEFVFRTEAPARFLAGQFAILHPPGVDGARAYSMSNLPNEAGEWRFVIRRRRRPGSNAMFDALATRRRPVASTRPTGGPTGATTMRATSSASPAAPASARSLRSSRRRSADGGARRIHVFEGARTEADLCFRKLVAGRVAGARLCAGAVGRAGRERLGGRARLRPRRMSRRTPFRSKAREFYFAGPPPMIEAMNDLLVMRWRAPLGQIHTDKFF